jgi:hypothetical protein
MKLIIGLFSIQTLLATSALARLQAPLVSIAPTKNSTSLLDASAVATPPGSIGPDIRVAQVGGKSSGLVAPVRVGQVGGPPPVSIIATTLPQGAPTFDSSTVTYGFADKGGTAGIARWKAPAGVIPLDSTIVTFIILCKKKSQGGPWESATLTTTFVNDSGATAVMTCKLSPKLVPWEDGATVNFSGLKDAQGATLNTGETVLTRSASGNRMTLTGSFIL